VAAAIAGRETVRVDLSQKSLERGAQKLWHQTNLPGTGHPFYATDVCEVFHDYREKAKSSILIGLIRQHFRVHTAEKPSSRMIRGLGHGGAG